METNYWPFVFRQLKEKLHSSWLTIYILPVIGFLCSPFIGEYLMISKNSKLIGFGIGLTILLWSAILIIIQNSPKDENANSANIKTTSKVQSSDSSKSFDEKCFLIFPNKSLFDNWHQQVTFRLGLPKYARNLATEEVDENYFIKQYANWKKHPNPSDKRVRCGYNERLPEDLINKDAELKYKFIKVSYAEIEEMGFIKDKPNINEQEVFKYNIPELPEFTELKTPQTNRSWMITPEYNIELVMILRKREEKRNKYIFDLGSINNKSRISIYLDKNDSLCYRIIDEKSKAHIIKLSHNIFDKIYQFDFKYGKHPEKSYMEVYINGIAVAIHNFNYRVPFYYYDNNMIFIGANLDGTYCAKLKMYWANIFATKEQNVVQLMKFDFQKEDAIFLSDDEMVSYKDKGEKIDFHRR